MSKYASWQTTKRPFFRRAAAPAACMLALFYLGFHALSGERSVLALLKEARRLELLQAELAEVEAQREALEKKVRRLSSQSLDLDLLDEQARRILGVAGKDEVVVFLDDGQGE